MEENGVGVLKERMEGWFKLVAIQLADLKDDLLGLKKQMEPMQQHVTDETAKAQVATGREQERALWKQQVKTYAGWVVAGVNILALIGLQFRPWELLK